MLDIQTFDARAGGNVIYKALAHPLAAEAAVAFAATLQTPLAVYDPDGVASALWSMHPAMPAPTEVFVHDVAQIGQVRAGVAATPLTDLPHSACRTLLIAAFDAGRIEARIGFMIPKGMTVVSLDALKLPEDMLTQKARYLEKTNFATNYAFFRDTGAPGGSGLHTRLVTANYWAGYGGKVRLWFRLFDAQGQVLAQWEERTPDGVGGIAIDSSEVRARFGLPEFTGQLFVHAIGAAGHDIVKYALDTYGTGDEKSLSVTHDANAWPSDRYAGMPAPGPGELDAGAVARMFDEVAARCGALDVLVNNAGMQIETPGDSFDDAALLRVLGVDLVGPALCSRAALATFLARGRGGTIINTTSVHETIPKPGYAAYAMAKGGLGNLTRTLALEFAGRGIRVNAVGPGAVATDMNASWTGDAAARAAVEAHIPMGRAASPEEIATVFAFLASDEARYITGQTIYACGGLTLYGDFATNWAS